MYERLVNGTWVRAATLVDSTTYSSSVYAYYGASLALSDNNVLAVGVKGGQLASITQGEWRAPNFRLSYSGFGGLLSATRLMVCVLLVHRLCVYPSAQCNHQGMEYLRSCSTDQLEDGLGVWHVSTGLSFK